MTTAIYCYTLFIRKGGSEIEYYYQSFIYGADLCKGELKEDENLPSVRMLAKELKISALTVKKAYDALEEEGFAITIHGKGTYITAANTELLLEEQKKEIEADLEKAVFKARRCGISDEELKNLLELILEG